jgi:hypothetical protein
VRASELLTAAGRAQEAADVAAAAVKADEWAEGAYRALAAAQLAVGERRLGVATLDSCDRALAELGVEPAPATVLLRQRLAAC